MGAFVNFKENTKIEIINIIYFNSDVESEEKHLLKRKKLSYSALMAVRCVLGLVRFH